MRKRIKSMYKDIKVGTRTEMLFLGVMFNVFDNFGNTIKRKIRYVDVTKDDPQRFINFKGNDYLLNDRVIGKVVNGKVFSGFTVKSKTLNFKSPQTNYKPMYSVKKNY